MWLPYKRYTSKSTCGFQNQRQNSRLFIQENYLNVLLYVLSLISHSVYVKGRCWLLWSAIRRALRATLVYFKVKYFPSSNFSGNFQQKQWTPAPGATLFKILHTHKTLTGDSGSPRRVRWGSSPQVHRRAGHRRAEPLAEKRVRGPRPLQGCCRRGSLNNPYPSGRPKEKRPAAHGLQAEPGSPASSPCGTHHDADRRSSYSALELPPLQEDPQYDPRATWTWEKTAQRAGALTPAPRSSPQKWVAALARAAIRPEVCASATDASTRRRKKRGVLSRLF